MPIRRKDSLKPCKIQVEKVILPSPYLQLWKLYNYCINIRQNSCVKPGTNEMKERFHIGFMIGGKQRAGPAPGCSSLHIPDFAEKRRELVVIDAPGHQHLGVVVVECPQLRQAAQETGEMLGVLRLMDLAQLL